MEAIATQIKILAAAADEKAHRQLVDGFRQLLYAIERPEDTAHRLIFGHAQLAVARIAHKSKLIDVLVKNGRKPLTIAQVAKETGMEPLLTERILRFMAAMGMADQTSSDEFAADKNTEALDIPGIRAGVGFGMDIVSPSVQALPEFLEKNGYKSPNDIDDCPWHPAHNKDMNVMQYLFSHPPVLEEFNSFMTHQRLDSNSWLDRYPVDLSATNPEQAFFVDIGGGVGHICVALQQRYPDLPGRVVLQDVPQSTNTLPAGQPFEPMAHDYYTEQPVKGARYYYLRNIMHNLAEDGCRTVLERTKAAMGPDSKILVDEIVVPAKEAHWRTVQLDLLMMSALGSMERTEEQWHSLFESVGLKMAKKYIYDDVQGDAVLEVIKS